MCHMRVRVCLYVYSRSVFAIRLADEETSAQLSGYGHNAIPPFGKNFTVLSLP